VTVTVSSRAVANEPYPQNARPTPHTSQQFNANLLAHFYSAPVAWFCSTLDINFSAFPEEHPSC
jgi:hypothetical protein